MNEDGDATTGEAANRASTSRLVRHGRAPERHTHLTRPLGACPSARTTGTVPGNGPCQGLSLTTRVVATREPHQRLLQTVAKLFERRPARVGLHLVVGVWLEVQILAAHGAETGAIRRVQDLDGERERDRIAGTRRQL